MRALGEKVGVLLHLLVPRRLSSNEVYFLFGYSGYVSSRKGSFLTINHSFPPSPSFFSSLPHVYFSVCFLSIFEDSFVSPDACLLLLALIAFHSC